MKAEGLRKIAGRLLLASSAGCLMVAWSGLFDAPAAHAAVKGSREGASLFHEKGCEHCHGVDGVGTERAPDLSGIGRAWHKPEIERQIRQGGKEMPPFGDVLTNDEVQDLVAYLAGKKKTVKPAPKPGKPATAGNDSEDVHAPFTR